VQLFGNAPSMEAEQKLVHMDVYKVLASALPSAAPVRRSSDRDHHTSNPRRLPARSPAELNYPIALGTPPPTRPPPHPPAPPGGCASTSRVLLRLTPPGRVAV
jgi:hypothetical protein